MVIVRVAFGGVSIMGTRVADESARAIFPEARSSHEIRGGDFHGTIVPEPLWFAVMVRTLWPVKAAAAIEQYTGTPDRTARAYQRGDREPSATVLRDLLRSTEGFRVLKAILDPAPPQWWRNVQSELRLAVLARSIFNQLETEMGTRPQA